MKHLDIKTINFLINCCKFWKMLAPFLGFAYLVGWMTLIFEDPVHLVINDAIGLLPGFIDSLFLRQADIFGAEHNMGYIYSAALVIILMYFAYKFQIYLEDCRMQKENEVKIVDVKKIKRINKDNEKTKDTTYKYTHFFGLLELNLKYEIEDNKTKDELEKLKKEYLKMLTDKLSKKYSNVRFKLTDKVFFVSDEFLIFDPFLIDISKLYKIFVDLDNQKGIRTELLLSFSAGSEKNNEQYIEVILKKINQLKYVNKVIASNEIYEKYKAIKAQQFEFNSLGLARLELDSNKEVDVDLYYLKKV